MPNVVHRKPTHKNNTLDELLLVLTFCIAELTTTYVPTWVIPNIDSNWVGEQVQTLNKIVLAILPLATILTGLRTLFFMVVKH